jgi:uncharacterized coiled-coil DUF342 family protein
MSDDVVKRLRRINQHYDLARSIHQDIRAAADCIEELEAKLAKAVEERDEALNQLDSARYSVNVLESRVANLMHGYDAYRKPFVTSRNRIKEDSK